MNDTRDSMSAACAKIRKGQRAKGGNTNMPRRARRNSFGTVISTGSKSNPAFSIRWWEGSQRRKTSGFKTRTEASEALARVRAGLSDGTMIVKRGASIGFDKVAESWLDLHSKPSLRSHSLNQLNYDAHVEPYFKDTPLAAVTAERVLKFRAHMQRKTRAAGKDEDGESIRVPISPGTVNVVLRLLRSILKFAAATGYIPASPTDRIGRGKLMLPVEEPKLAPMPFG
jgi:hypothetical protein